MWFMDAKNIKEENSANGPTGWRECYYITMNGNNADLKVNVTDFKFTMVKEGDNWKTAI